MPGASIDTTTSIHEYYCYSVARTYCFGIIRYCTYRYKIHTWGISVLSDNSIDHRQDQPSSVGTRAVLTFKIAPTSYCITIIIVLVVDIFADSGLYLDVSLEALVGGVVAVVGRMLKM